MTLSDEELERYARHIVLREFGAAGQIKLRNARVTVVGAGGIGAPVLFYLAAGGVGHLTVIDDDVVALSNLQRQTIYTASDVGTAKAAAAVAPLNALNPNVTIVAESARARTDNADALLAGADVIVDGTDSFATRLTVADAAWRLRIPLVSAAVGQFHGQIGTWKGWEKNLPCYRCFVGDAFDSDDCDTCADDGVLGPMTGLAGSLAALEAMREIVRFGESSSGKLHLIDGLAPAFRTIRVPKDAACKTCGHHELSD